jgi:CHAT domain-containing protein
LAHFVRGLGLVLTISMAATDPSSAIRVGSPDPSRWWETDNFADLIEAAQKLRAEGDFAGLAAIYATGYQRAIGLANIPAQIAYLSNLGTARMVQFQFAAAIETFLRASALAEQVQDWTDLGAIAVNLSGIYQEMGDAGAALGSLERAKAAIDRAQRAPPYKAQLLMRLRAVRADLNKTADEPQYAEAIEAARQSGDPEGEATAWDLLGQEQATAGEFDTAEASIGRALRLRTAYSRKTLSFSYAALGSLRLEQARQAAPSMRLQFAREAEALTTRAILSRTGSGPAKYVLLHQRGLARELRGQTELALQDFHDTVKQATGWNGSVPAALSLITGANATIQQEMFDSFIESAARRALKTKDQSWAEKAFLALESNRAASLRESRELAEIWREKLPSAYWETLARLNQEERQDGPGKETPEAKRLHLKLTEMESSAGVGFTVSLAENFRTRNSLIHFRHGLGESDLILSFYLGKRESYVWAVTRDSLELHRLPSEGELRERIRRYRDAVIAGRSAISGESPGDKLGADLYQCLLGSVTAKVAAKPSWLLSLDKELFELPFAALVAGHNHGRPVYVAEQHTSEVIPGAMFAVRASRPQGGYLGVGDPVYNSADPRRASPAAAATGQEFEMNRLVNSARELRRSIAAWRSAFGAGQPATILQGTSAHRGAFLDALQQRPNTIHLATHVLTPGHQSGQAFVAFSLETNGQPGLLSTRDIGLLQVPGALVVMTGCAAATGDAKAGAGLLGLTRAWLMAGATAVVGTNWSIPDADGDLIPAFYRNLRQSSTAEALRRSQIEMIHSGTWQAAPAYWAAFQVTESGR